MNNNYSLYDVIGEILKWKKYILGIVFLTGLVAGILSFLKPNYYKAETVFFAANPGLADPVNLGYQDDKRNVYGNSNDIDRLFTILLAPETMMHLIKKFNLYSHYKIDSTTANGRVLMMENFKSNYTVTKSKYDAMQLTVEDTDPILAAAIANEARNFANITSQKIVKNTQHILLEGNSEEIAKNEKITQKLIDSLKFIKAKHKLIEPDYQARALADEIVRAQGNLADARAKTQYYKELGEKRDSFIKYQAITLGYQNKLIELNSILQSFNSGVSQLKSLEQEFSRAADQVSISKEKNKINEAAYNKEFISLHLVSEATPPERKSRPKRSILILSSMLISFLVSIFGILFLHSISKKVQ
ncbi:MAG: hypothetical protein RLZZ546_3118 [Bacteroidota bacterium]|jgi:LPS O-antigen subunit length determinant protein (WzzB/FepE family)